MKKLILTSAFILGSIVTLFAQQAKPGSPIGGIVVKGGHNGIAAITGNPLYNPSGTETQNPMSELRSSDGNPIGGIIVKGALMVNDNGTLCGKTGHFIYVNPIDGIIVKGVNAIAGNVSPLYDAQGLEVTSALYAGGGH